MGIAAQPRMSRHDFDLPGASQNRVPNELRPSFEMLIRGGRRQPLAEMNGFMREFGEQEITSEEYRTLSSGIGQ